MTDSMLDDFAEEIVLSWKSVGRRLGVPESKLMTIDVDYRYEGEQEKAFRMLYVFKEMDPNNCVAGHLHEVAKGACSKMINIEHEHDWET